jgi:hypothetical protein
MGKRKADATVLHTNKHVKVGCAGFCCEVQCEVEPCILVLKSSYHYHSPNMTRNTSTVLHASQAEAALPSLARHPATVVSHCDHLNHHMRHLMVGWLAVSGLKQQPSPQVLTRTLACPLPLLHGVSGWSTQQRCHSSNSGQGSLETVTV